jgi:hypothetical protein
MKKVSLLISILCVTAIAGFSQQSSLEGTLIDKESGEPLLFANVILYQNGVFVAGMQTDFDGNFELTNLVPGVYDLELQYVGYREKRVEGVVGACRPNPCPGPVDGSRYYLLLLLYPIPPSTH